MTSSPLDIEAIRSQFPALKRREGGRVVAYLDGPGGTQVPQRVAFAMSSILHDGVSNLGGGYGASDLAESTTAAARMAMARLFNAEPGEIVFGQNMTSLTFAVSRAIAATWRPGDAIVLTSLDHDANFTPWLVAAEEKGVEVRVAEFDPASGRLDPSEIEDLLDERVRLVAVCLASNSIGTVVDVASVGAAAHEAGALVFVDAVHAAPHITIDVRTLDCDFLVTSAYKFFGPHTGILYGRLDLLAEIDAYKVRPAPSDPPGKWETGTQSFESIAGVCAAIDYLGSLGTGDDTRTRLTSAYGRIAAHERSLGEKFLTGLETLPAARLHGVQSMEGRVATFAVAVEGHDPSTVARHLIDAGLYVWSGHYYAVNVMDRLGVLETGGLVRIGFVHYNTDEEVDRTLEALERLT